MKKSELRKIIKEEIQTLNEWWTDIDGKSKKEIQDLLINSGFDKTKVKRASDNSLATLYDIAKRQGKLKENINESPDSKDLMRIKDMQTKSNDDESKMIKLAIQMANVIKDGAKAARRMEAAEQILGDKHPVVKVFKDRAIKLGYAVDNNPAFKSGDKGVIYLPTLSAIALWDREILGQLSDGAWENASPQDHWIFWSNLDVKKGKPEVKGGGYAKKTSYNLTSLLQYVGDRMEATGRLAKALNKLPTSDQEHAGEYMPKTFDEFKDMLSGKTKSYGVKYLKAIPIKVAKKYYETSYDKKDLIKDLKYIKQAMKTA